MSASDYGEFIEEQFPGVQFTGGSEIHRSYAHTTYINHSRANVQPVMAVLCAVNAGGMLWQHLRSKFKGIEGLIPPNEFSALWTVEVFKLLQGDGPVKTANRLTNPRTGNRFHRVILKDSTVGGIRALVSSSASGTSVGYRLRLENLEAAAEKDTRAQAAELGFNAIGEAQEMLAFLNLQPATPEQLEAYLQTVSPLFPVPGQSHDVDEGEFD